MWSVFVRYDDLRKTIEFGARSPLISYREFEEQTIEQAMSRACMIADKGVRYHDGQSWLIVPPHHIHYIEVRGKVASDDTTNRKAGPADAG